jgi:uncharacterized protein YkwD
MWRIAAVALAAALLGMPAAASAAAACPGADSAPSQLAAGERAGVVLCLFNDERAGRGLAPLQLDRRLSRAARGHSADMVAHHYFAHPSPSGTSFVTRIARTGWLHGRADWHVGEVLAWGTGSYATPRSAVAALMDSARHRKVILGGFRSVGIGVILGVPFSDDDGATYTADFGN